ncbi:hypothetical protein ANN_16969 [Periplaneta americana]|uniref:Uncharacterized protein n=1 Tax=Periplaneta americana TaxID=6978 RepID=A0ABQ8ST32_PERAM|nr:hypothetical protein ANN_16969 [Periplaneta americana]
MAGLCEGGNDPPGSLKAIKRLTVKEMNNDRESKTNSARKAENPHDNVVYVASVDVKTACECFETPRMITPEVPNVKQP